jgi:hypothetical protein
MIVRAIALYYQEGYYSCLFFQDIIAQERGALSPITRVNPGRS